MEIEESIVLVTGANRGLGAAYVEAILAAGAAKVYACARDIDSINVTESRVVPIKLDVTSRDVEDVAQQCDDVTIVINNAGLMNSSPVVAPSSDEIMRREMEVNVYGVLSMINTFAPILARNGGGAFVNMLSVVSWFTSPFNGTYCASKHAALAITDGARIQLKAQGTKVVAVYAGFIDTDMAASVNFPKSSPKQVAERTLEGLRSNQDHVLADQRAYDVFNAMRVDPNQMTIAMQQAWDQQRQYD